MDGVLICEFCGGMVMNPTTPHKCGGSSVFPVPNYLWEIVIGDELGITIKFETRRPNWFQRFMYKLLLGWEIRLL